MLEVWNHPDIQYIRRIQTGGTTYFYGCKGCGYFSNQLDKRDTPYFTFEAPPDLSEKQRQNLECAKAEFEAGVIEVKSLSLCQLFFFGYQCNIDCILPGDMACSIYSENLRSVMIRFCRSVGTFACSHPSQCCYSLSPTSMTARNSLYKTH